MRLAAWFCDVRTTPVATAPATLAPAYVATAHATALATSVPPSPLTPRCCRRRAESPTSVQVRTWWLTEEESDGDGSQLSVLVESFAKVLEDPPNFSSRLHGQLTFGSIKPSQRGVTVGKRTLLSREEEESDDARLRGFVESCRYSASERWRAAELFRAALQHYRLDQPAKPKTAYSCFCIMWRTPLQKELFWELQEPGSTSLPGSQCSELISCRLGREWHELRAEQQQAYQPASESAKAYPQIAGQVSAERLEKRQRVNYSRKAGMGGEGALARLEVPTFKIPPAIVQTASTETIAPPGKKWNACTKKWVPGPV